MNKIVMLLLMMALHQAQAGPGAAFLCATACNAACAGCMAAIVWSTGGFGAIIAAGVCKAGLGVCMTGCGAVVCAPTP